MRPKKLTGKDRYEIARDAGLSRHDAARNAGISLAFADHVENLRNREAGSTVNVNEPMHRDDALVSALVAAGGYPRLSERLHRTGHVVCLPLVPFEARP